MESLPIQYFDTHAHGDIMSVYTNDVDTLRQLISQSIPQMINSLVTMVTTLVSMFVLDMPLTLLTIAMTVRHALCHLENRRAAPPCTLPSSRRTWAR